MPSYDINDYTEKDYDYIYLELLEISVIRHKVSSPLYGVKLFQSRLNVTSTKHFLFISYENSYKNKLIF